MQTASIHQQFIGVDDIRSLSKLNPAKSIAAIIFEWVIIGFAIVLHIHFSGVVIYLISWILIGSRMYALYSILHDGMHYLLFPNKKMNDWICKLLLAYPLFMSFDKARKHHLAHHRHLQTSLDPEFQHLNYPEFQFPKKPIDWIFIFLKDITGFNLIYYKIKKLLSFSKQSSSENTNDAAMLFYYLIIGAVILYFGWGVYFLLYWLIPFITIYQALNRLRLSTEHFHLPEDKLFITRTVRLSFVERFIFSPHNLGFHTEHHLYPSVPFYRLKNLHEKLMSFPQFRQNLILNKSYFQVICEYIK